MFNFLSKMSNLQQRLLVGIFGAAFIISGICVSQWSYLFVIFCISIFSLIEFHNLLNSAGISTNKFVSVLLGLILLLGSFFVSEGYLKYTFYLFFVALAFIVFFIELFQTHDKPFERIAYSFLSVVYTVLPYALLNYVVFRSGQYDFRIILGILFLIWANDTGGYFGGRYLGKHKLYERISPKKTWEGSISGALLSLVIAFALHHFFPGFSIAIWIGLSLIIVVAGSLGDLVESQLKRSLSIKDSGSSIPGHGGFLDRFDGLIIALPFIVVYFELL